MTSERRKGITLFFGENGLKPVYFSFSIGENNRETAIGTIMPMKTDNTPEENTKAYQKIDGSSAEKEKQDSTAKQVAK